MKRAQSSLADGVLAGLVQLAAGEFAAAALPGARSPVSGAGRALIDATPGPVVDVTVATAQRFDKHILRASLVTGLLGAGVLSCSPVLTRNRGAGLLGVVGVGCGAAGASRADARAGTSLAAGAAAGAAGAITARVLRRHRGARSLRLGLAALAGGAGASAARRRRAQHAEVERLRSAIHFPAPAMAAGVVPAGAEFALPGLTALRTEPGAFYVTDVQFPAPQIDLRAWRLRVSGMVDHPLELSFGDLLEMDLQEIDATLVCVHNPVGGDRISSGRWLGVPLAALLARAGVQADAEQLVARSTDGFTAGIPVAHILAGQPALLALGYGGEPLRVANGFPARVLCPGLWGADANTKWVTELELTTWGAVRDYWDRRGWPRVPSRVRPGSRIDLPANRSMLSSETVTVAGVAWAPPHGIEQVDVAIDDGPWQPAEMSVELAPTMWRHWRLRFDADAGEHRVRARAIGRRATQSEHAAPPYPVGASGHHEIRFMVTDGRAHPSARPTRAWQAATDDLSERVALAVEGVRSWLHHGFPPPRRFPAPAPTGAPPQA